MLNTLNGAISITLPIAFTNRLCVLATTRRADFWVPYSRFDVIGWSSESSDNSRIDFISSRQSNATTSFPTVSFDYIAIGK